jgi:probable rRNA maturation factor
LRRARGAPALDARRVQTLCNRMLAALELEHAELSVLLTDDRTIHALNLEHRRKDRPTDVLAFALREDATVGPMSDCGPSAGLADGERCLGDIVISLDTAARQARGRRRPLLDEVRFLLAHGLLHLVGYDHDTKTHKRRMDRMTRRLVAAARVEAKHQTPRVTADRPTRKQRGGTRRTKPRKAP